MTSTTLSTFLDKIETTSGRNQMMEDLAEFLPHLKGEEISQAMYLMMGRLTPKYEDVEFNVSTKLALRALEQITDQDVDILYSSLGDVGLVAEQIAGAGDSEISVSEVYSFLYKITEESGSGSQEAKMQMVADLVQKLDPISARYAVRVIIGKLRLGLSDKTILDALSWILTGDKTMRAQIERAYGARADLGFITSVVLQSSTPEEAAEALSKVTVTPGVPIASKLVEREKDSAKSFERMGTSIVQPKLDGLRAQVHFDKANGVSEVFSRNMESLTVQFPDILEAVAKLGVDSIIIDSEAIGYDLDNDTYLPFNDTMTRRRKHGVEDKVDEIPVKSMAFDVLYLNGQDMTQTPVEQRVQILKDILEKSDQDVIRLLDSPTLKTFEELDEYFIDKITQGLEGLIIKKLGTTYDPGTRNFDWIKLKANTQSHMVDTVDVVVIGYYHGRGERAAYGFGSLLTAVYNPADEKYYSVAKVGSGFTDELAPKVKADLNRLQVDAQPSEYVVENNLRPDVWVRPEIVIEIDADEITRSPSHTACRDLKADFEKDPKGKGLSLRFPRLKVWNRDKGPTQATTTLELLRMYELRKGN